MRRFFLCVGVCSLSLLTLLSIVSLAACSAAPKGGLEDSVAASRGWIKIDNTEMRETARTVITERLSSEPDFAKSEQDWWVGGAIPVYKVDSGESLRASGELVYPVFARDNLQLMLIMGDEKIWEDGAYRYSLHLFKPSNEVVSLISPETPCLFLEESENASPQIWLLTDEGSGCCFETLVCDVPIKVSRDEVSKTYRAVKGKAEFSQPSDKMSL